MLLEFFNKKNKTHIATTGQKSLFEQIATMEKSGNFSGFLDVLPNPDPVLRKRGINIKEYRKLLVDSHVGACVESRKSGTTSLLWKLKSKDNKSKIYEVIESLFDEIDLYALIEDILNAPLYGYQPIEITWKKIGNLILPVEFEAKPQEWFAFDSNNEFRIKTKRGSELIAQNKFLLPRNKKSYINPYGEAILSRVFWSTVFKKNGLKFFLYFLEKYGTPQLWATSPRNASQAEIDKIAQILENMVQDCIAVIPEGTQIDIKEPANKGASATIYNSFLDRCDKEISKGILGQTLTTDVGTSGSYAAGNVHLNVRQDIVDSDTRLVENTINHLIRIIDDLNFNSGDITKIKLYKEKDVNKTLAERDEILTRTGVKFKKEHYINNHGLSDDEFELSDPQAGSINFSKPEEPEIISSSPMDDEEMENITKGLLNPVLKIYEKTKNPVDALEKLSDVYPEMNSEELEKKLTKIIFASEVLGHIEAKNDSEK